MEEDIEYSPVDIHLSNAQWMSDHADKLIKEYKAAKTEHQKAKLIPQLIQLQGRLQKELNDLDGLRKLSEGE